MNSVIAYKVEELISAQLKGLWGEELDEGCSGIKVIKTNNMSYDGHIDFENVCERKIPLSDASANYLEYGDLLIEKSGGTKTHSVGYVNFFDGNEHEYVSNNFILAIRPNKQMVNPKFLFYYLKYLYESGSLEDCYNKTTGIQNLKTKSYLSKRILVPSFDEQKRIVSILDGLSKAVNCCNKQIGLYDELIKTRFAEMFEMCETKKELGELTTKITDGSHNPPKGIEKSDYLMLSSQNIFNELDLSDVRYLTKEDFDRENKRTDIQENDVLLTIVGTIGRTHVVRKGESFTFQRSVGVIKPIGSILNGTYLSICLHTDDVVNQLESSGHGSSQKGVYLQDLKKISIPVPSIESQNEFASFVKMVNDSLASIKSRIHFLNEITKKKAQDYFGGNE